MFQLSTDQSSQVSAIGNDAHLPIAVRRLAWLAVRAAEGLGEEEIAGAVGLSVDCTRHWLRILEERGPALFDRFFNGGNGGHDIVAPVTVEDLRAITGFTNEEGEFVSRVALQLFDYLGAHHRLGSHHRGMLESAAMLHGLGDALVGTGTDGVYFSVLDPTIQELPPDEKRVLAALMCFRSGPVDRKRLKTLGLKGDDARSTLLMISLLRMAVALNASRSMSTVIARMESSELAAYLILKGSNAAEDGAACEASATPWRKLTGMAVRTLTRTGTRLPGERHEMSLYRARLKSPGITAEDTLGLAGRKAMRFLLSAMLRQENRVYLGQDPEALHKMRVNTRRLRSAFRVFRAGFSKKELKPFKKRFAELGRDLGALRDLDVILADVREYCDVRGPDEQRAMIPLVDYLSARRLEALIITRELLRSRRYLTFIRNFHDFVADEEHVTESGPRVSDVGPIQVYERIAEIRECARGIDTPTVEQLHQLRIRFKQLRYTLEFYGDVLSQSTAGIIETLKGVQDHLGKLQDFQAACAMVDEFLRVATPQDGVVRTAVETYRRGRQDRQQPLIDGFGDVWDGFDNGQMRANIALAVARF